MFMMKPSVAAALSRLGLPALAVINNASLNQAGNNAFLPENEKAYHNRIDYGQWQHAFPGAANRAVSINTATVEEQRINNQAMLTQNGNFNELDYRQEGNGTSQRSP